MPAAECGIGPGAVQAPADDEGRVKPAFGEQTRNQAGHRRLAVRTCDRDTEAEAHELSQHLGARDDRNAYLLRGAYFRVVIGDGGRTHQHIAVSHCGSIVADGDAHTEAAQAPDRRVLRHVRAGNLVAQVVQHFSDAAHAGAADADQANAADAPHAQGTGGMLRDVCRRRLRHAPPPRSNPPPHRPHRAVPVRAPSRHVEQTCAPPSARKFPAASTRPTQEQPLGQQHRCTRRGQILAVACLVIVHRMGIGHQNRAESGRGQLGDGERAGPAHDHVRPGIRFAHIIDERRHSRSDAERRILRTHCFVAIAPGLVPDFGTLSGSERHQHAR